MCLEDGEPWEAGSTGMGGFIGGVSSSIIMVPLLSWYDGDTGSVGGLKNLKPPEVRPLWLPLSLHLFLHLYPCIFSYLSYEIPESTRMCS